jgi:hypothetical protein
MAIRLGTEDKKKRLIAGVCVSVALTLIAHTVWQLASGPSPTPPPPAASEATQTTVATSRAVAPSGPAAQHLESATALDPTLHPERMAMAENTEYTGTSRNIFSKDSLPPVPIGAIESPIASARTTTGPAAIAGPPPPPPIDLKFYGFAKQQNGRKLVFLMHGEDVFIAGPGDIVDGRYKVIQINDNSVVIEDLAYTNQQTLPLLIS